MMARKNKVYPRPGHRRTLRDRDIESLETTVKDPPASRVLHSKANTGDELGRAFAPMPSAPPQSNPSRDIESAVPLQPNSLIHSRLAVDVTTAKSSTQVSGRQHENTSDPRANIEIGAIAVAGPGAEDSSSAEDSSTSVEEENTTTMPVVADAQTTPVPEALEAYLVDVREEEELRREVEGFRSAPLAQVVTTDGERRNGWCEMKRLTISILISVCVLALIVGITVPLGLRKDAVEIPNSTNSTATSPPNPELLSWAQLGPAIEGPEVGDLFGQSVSLAEPGGISLHTSVERMAVSAPGSNPFPHDETYGGLVIVYDFSNDGTATQVGQAIPGTEPGNEATGVLSKDGTHLAITEPYFVGNSSSGEPVGQVRVFTLGSSSSPTIIGRTSNEINWTMIGSPLMGSAGTSKSMAVALSRKGDILAVGSQVQDDNGYSGRVRIYQYQENAWVQLGTDISCESIWDKSGYSLSLSDDGFTVAIGADYFTGAQNRGKVQVFVYDTNDWSQLGSDIEGRFKWNGDHYGVIVSLSSDGRTVAASALGAYRNGNAGVFFYDDSSGDWHQLGGNLEGDGGDDVINQVTLAGDGNRVAIASSWKDESYVYVYDYTESTWTQIGEKLSGQHSDEKFGDSLALSSLGNRLAVGSPAPFASPDTKGLVRLYELQLAE